MLVAALALALQAPTSRPPAITDRRDKARPALSAASFPAGRTISDAQGKPVGQVVRVDGGLVTIKTERSLVAVPTSAFETRGKELVVALSAVQIELLAGNRPTPR